ncbi:MAG: methyl-accepting chemotaxis protein [Burkholderiales bacterium]
MKLAMTIGRRVALAFCAVLATIVSLVAVVLWQLSASVETSERTARSLGSLESASKMGALAKDNAIASLVILVTPSEKQQAKLAAEITDRDGRIAAEIDALAKRVAGSAEDEALVEEVRKRYATQRAGVKRIVDLVKGGKQSEAAFSADEEMIPMMAPFLVAVSKLDTRQFEVLHASEESARGTLVALRRFAIGAGVAAALLSVAAGLLLVRSVVRPIGQAVEVAERVAAGDLTARIEVRGRDEVAQLLGALARMNGGLADIVRRVRGDAESIATNSREIAEGSNDLAQRTEEAAGHLRATAASMDELAVAVHETAENAERATGLATDAKQAVIGGGELMGRAVGTMDEISASSRRIAEITGVIDGIAFQTNILALNAAVEAARAGEQGRGFAVVAAEVRSLAQRSATAAREVRQLIDASAARVTDGAALVKEAGDRVAGTVERVQRMSELIAEVAGSARQQAAGIEAVHAAVSQLDQVVQRNAAMVEESTAGTAALDERAQALVEAVGAFRVGETPAAA